MSRIFQQYCRKVNDFVPLIEQLSNPDIQQRIAATENVDSARFGPSQVVVARPTVTYWRLRTVLDGAKLS